MFPDDFDGIIAGAPGNRTAMATVDRARAAERSGQPHPAGEVSADPPGGAGGLRCRATG